MRECRSSCRAVEPSIWVSTHAFCQGAAAYIDNGISKAFTIFDSSDQKSAMKKALSMVNLEGTNLEPDALLHAISSAKSELISCEDYAHKASGFWERQVAKVYPVYQRVLRENNALDFDDLLVKR